ncbi:complement component C8 gamma chain isoform X2 [Manis javanica]|uniref:complement component C8 gamma chain isoform X2 n=1 Tax=Manis javanica TaxID=9974 RepID=UPI003C6D400C
METARPTLRAPRHRWPQRAERPGARVDGSCACASVLAARATLLGMESSGQEPRVNSDFVLRTWRRGPARKCWVEARCPRAAFLLTLLPAIGSLDYRAQRPPRPLSHFSTIQPKAGFDAQQFAGTWLLVAVASSCRFLQEQGHQAEATALQVAPQGAAMRVSTFRKLDGICWQVQQLYRHTRVPGHFLLQAQGAHGKVDVVVGETDYHNFAILYLQRAQQLSVKLYVRSLPASDAALSAFEQRVQRADLTEDHILFFPNYGFCEAADQFHILDEVKR